MYKVPWANCDKTYVGETGRKFGVRLQEHRTEVEAKTTQMFTRSQRVSSLSEHNKSALTDHAAHENHMINWSKAMVIDRSRCDFPGGSKRQYISARKANMLWIGTRAAINSVTPMTAFLKRHRSVVSRTGRTEYQLLLMKASDWGRNVNFR